jgi:hypothetical protein
METRETIRKRRAGLNLGKRTGHNVIYQIIFDKGYASIFILPLPPASGQGRLSNDHKILDNMSSTKRKRSDTGDSKNDGDMGSKKTVKHAYKHTLAADPSSYSLAATTVQQQSEKESNFIGDAFFFQMHLPPVSRILQSKLFSYFSDLSDRFSAALLAIM